MRSGTATARTTTPRSPCSVTSDSASVVRGFVGGPPKTAWVIDYALLERIHTLLVSGFDVFGNVGHQLTTRMYMDFLRMEGEANFLVFLPPERRRALADCVVSRRGDDVKAEVYAELADPTRRRRSSIAARLRSASCSPRSANASNASARATTTSSACRTARCARCSNVSPAYARTRRRTCPSCRFWRSSMPDGSARYVSILRDSAHTNVAQLFDEEDRRVEEEDALDVVPGFLGAYPNALFAVPRSQFGAFVSAVEHLNNREAYVALRKRFGALRTSEQFWPHSDRMDAARRKQGARDGGLFDYNRLEAY